MRALLAALIVCACVAMPACAGYLMPPVAPEWGAHHLVARHAIVRKDKRRAQTFMPRAWSARRRSVPLAGVLSAACQVARALGGPCGCFASEYFFGHSVRGLWLVNAWLSFPHVAPAPGTAAVWPNRHVAPVIAANGDGTVTVRDFWAIHRVRVAGLVFVDPRGGMPPIRARRRYANA